MNCFTCEQNITAYIDDELGHDQRRDVESHLAECDRCRQDYESQMTAWEIASNADAVEAPGDLWSRIEAQLPKRESGTSVEDLALIVKGLASEVRELRQTVEEMRDRDTARSGYEAEGRVREQIRSRPELSIWTEPGLGQRTG